MDYTLQDSGARETYDSGMMREPETGKPRFDLLIPLDVPYEHQLLTRAAVNLSKGSGKYEERNWEQASGVAEMARAKSSAFRHFMQWMTGETDEDHAAGVVFNLLVHETTAYKINARSNEPGERGRNE